MLYMDSHVTPLRLYEGIPSIVIGLGTMYHQVMGMEK